VRAGRHPTALPPVAGPLSEPVHNVREALGRTPG
jgi:hypothetical protein